MRKAQRELAKAQSAQERLNSAKGQPNGSRPATKPGAAKPPKRERPFNTPDHDREARQLANAHKQVAYYAKEHDALRRKLARARSMDEHLIAAEASVSHLGARGRPPSSRLLCRL